jgi:hypothetical protein
MWLIEERRHLAKELARAKLSQFLDAARSARTAPIGTYSAAADDVQRPWRLALPTQQLPLSKRPHRR